MWNTWQRNLSKNIFFRRLQKIRAHHEKLFSYVGYKKTNFFLPRILPFLSDLHTKSTLFVWNVKYLAKKSCQKHFLSTVTKNPCTSQKTFSLDGYEKKKTFLTTFSFSFPKLSYKIHTFCKDFHIWQRNLSKNIFSRRLRKIRAQHKKLFLTTVTKKIIKHFLPFFLSLKPTFFVKNKRKR